jgi:hypothetical protein
MKVALARGGLAVCICLTLAGMARAQVSISVNSTFPSDIPNGAPGATLQQAAAFAWQEFIALNWPALAGPRDTPNPHQKFGAAGTGPSGSGPLLVWQTFRSKVEIFNLTKRNGVPPGYSATGPDYGYNLQPPAYYYGGLPHQVDACPTQTAPSSPAWINLDETTQITLDQMFAGGPAITGPTNTSPQSNTSPQLIRFAVKANHVEYEYIAKNKYFLPNNVGGPGQPGTPAYNNHIAYTANPPVAPTQPFISFPAGTVEIKSAWRPLNGQDDATHFHTQTVRFYENKGTNKTPCYFEQQWGLIALHIIQKTPTAPAFIYATFEQAENIRQPNGTPVEDVDGNVVNPISGAAPTTPAMTYMDSPTAPKVSISGPACTTTNNNQLYFEDNPSDPGLTGGGAVCVNARYEPIPSDVITVNQAAHQAIAAYDTAQGVSNSPWPYYKLVSVQPQPFDVSKISPTDPVHGAAVFFQANIVVETDYTLQQFQGRIGGNGAVTAEPSSGVPPPNVVTPAMTPPGVVAVNMGGCMGCHGNAQVTKGTDFSFILSEGITQAPETPSALSGAGSAALHRKYLSLFTTHK